MSEYEKGIVERHKKNGYKFLCDCVGENQRDVARYVARIFGISINEVMCIQGECLAFNEKRKKGYSRWLAFKKTETVLAQ